ncbi:MAG TPA: phosphotransferase [Candidatus Saccharimonadales bacterium]|nr:phosphotransferase [Candidatus Saccharimonadales bacterium]
MNIEQQIETHYGLKDVICKHLNTPVNDVVAVTTSSGKFALKLYNTASRTAKEVQWELNLVAHLLRHGAPVVRPVRGTHGYVGAFMLDGQERTAALYEWAPGEKPKAAHDTYVLLGEEAARIHNAADSFTAAAGRDNYDAALLIDEQLERMKPLLTQAGQWQAMTALSERLKRLIANPSLDYGICHMDLTLDNVHRTGDTLTVFDFDSAGTSWRALEPHGVLRFSKDYFKDWLQGYRSVRSFSEDDERAVAAFGIIGDLRVVAWKLGVAKSSRGKPLLTVDGLPAVVEKWVKWEREHIG